MIHTGRTDLDPEKQRYARDTDKRTLAEIVEGADIFLGLSAAGILTPEMVATMAPDPVIFALANPIPEIMPEAVCAVSCGCHYWNWAFGLSKSNQQCFVFSLLVPWCVGCGCDHDQ